VRFFLELAGLILLVAVPAAVVAIVWQLSSPRALTGRRRQAALRSATWQAESRVLDDRTVIAVSKSVAVGNGDENLGRMVIAEIPAADPEWDVKVSQALVDARVRAEILNQEAAISDTGSKPRRRA
jgi:hypothetical protein